MASGVTYDFSGKVALVTGGTSGIGRATAIAFGKAGAAVVISGRRQAEGEETARLVGEAGGRALFVRSDVAVAAETQALVDQVVKTFGGLDVAFNNAGIEGTLAPLHEQPDDVFDQVMAINVRGVFLSMKFEIAAMLKRGGGVIVNNSSVAGVVGFPSAGPYAASKHAVMGLTRAAALDYAAQGIRINAVNPGTIVTDMLDRFGATLLGGGVDEVRQQMAGFSAMKRVAKPEEIADAVLFLSSDAASYMTGQPLVVDGGLTAG